MYNSVCPKNSDPFKVTRYDDVIFPGRYAADIFHFFLSVIRVSYLSSDFQVYNAIICNNSGRHRNIKIAIKHALFLELVISNVVLFYLF